MRRQTTDPIEQPKAETLQDELLQPQAAELRRKRLRHTKPEAATATPAPRHSYKPLPRGDHEITVRLCYDCDSWHAVDDSILYNEREKKDWEADLAAARAERDLAVAEKQAAMREIVSLTADYNHHIDGLEAELAAARKRIAELEATVKRQRIWAQASMKGFAEDNRENADKLVKVDAMVAEQDTEIRQLEARAQAAETALIATQGELVKRLPTCVVCKGRPRYVFIDLRKEPELRCGDHRDSPLPHGRISYSDYHDDDAAWAAALSPTNDPSSTPPP